MSIDEVEKRRVPSLISQWLSWGNSSGKANIGGGFCGFATAREWLTCLSVITFTCQRLIADGVLQGPPTPRVTESNEREHREAWWEEEDCHALPSRAGLSGGGGGGW